MNVGERQTGTIKWLDTERGYSFIARDQGGDIFVHCNSVQDKSVQTLEKGQRVTFMIAKSDKGPQAQDVITL